MSVCVYILYKYIHVYIETTLFYFIFSTISQQSDRRVRRVLVVAQAAHFPPHEGEWLTVPSLAHPKQYPREDRQRSPPCLVLLRSCLGAYQPCLTRGLEMGCWFGAAFGPLCGLGAAPANLVAAGLCSRLSLCVSPRLCGVLGKLFFEPCPPCPTR